MNTKNKKTKRCLFEKHINKAMFSIKRASRKINITKREVMSFINFVVPHLKENDLQSLFCLINKYIEAPPQYIDITCIECWFSEEQSNRLNAGYAGWYNLKPLGSLEDVLDVIHQNCTPEAALCFGPGTLRILTKDDLELYIGVCPHCAAAEMGIDSGKKPSDIR